MGRYLTRRDTVRASLGIALASGLKSATAKSEPLVFGDPVGQPGQVFGDGFLIRHGYATENTWYLPGYLHSGEDWYATEGDAAGAGVFAAAAGGVVFAGSDYPGRVVIVQHAHDLFSMYGHLDYALPVAEGDLVARGQLLGNILARTDGRAPSHLHFEIRTFFITPEVNGNAPRYGFACGVNCPPGPGYWPIDAPEHPSAIGWRNPTHVIARRAWGESVPAGVEVVVSTMAPDTTSLWSAPGGSGDASTLADLPLTAGDTYPLLDIAAGEEDSTGTSAEAYQVWYQIEVEGDPVWVQAAVPVANDTGADGRPSSVHFDFLPLVIAPGG